MFDNIKYICHSNKNSVFASPESIKPLIPFYTPILDFLNELSLMILKSKEAKEFPDIITFAFWCRKASLSEIEKEYKNYNIRLGRGIIFHIAPSNIPINFVYSLVAGLLSGNANIVKVSSKEFKQVDIVCSYINELLKDRRFEFLSDYITIIRYDHNKNVTDYLCSICDIRMIWGGDNTINEIRQSALKPKSFDITFSDRYSICIINADNYISENDPIKIGNNFYNDTYLFDQNACTSPHLVLWFGNEKNIEKSKEQFWGILNKLVKEKYNMQPISVIDKYTAACECAIKLNDIIIESIIDNRIVRIKLKTLTKNIEEFKQHSGYFFECNIKSLEELYPIVNRKYQTLSYYGFDKNKFEDFCLNNKCLFGIDRIVPIGKTLDFSLTWDGYDLINTLSRIIQVH